MKAFEFASPASLPDALSALAAGDDSAPLAGGTDLINRMKDYITSPKRVVYLKDVKALAGISEQYKEVSAVRVCEQGGQPYYVVNVAGPSGESRQLVINAVDGSR